MQSSKDRIKDVVAQGLAPMFKAHGFRMDTALPAFYGVQADTPTEAFAREIASVVERVYVQPLAAVHNVKDFDALGWARAVPWSFPALIAYAVGHVEDARRLVQAEADHFADRGCTFESVAASLGLKF